MTPGFRVERGGGDQVSGLPSLSEVCWAGARAGRAPNSRGRCGGSRSRRAGRSGLSPPWAASGAAVARWWSHIMDRNPSPPPPSRDEDEEVVAGGDCIGSTVYSKHWLFGVLSGLIQVWKVAFRLSPDYLSPDPRPRLWQPLLPGSRHLHEDPSAGTGAWASCLASWPPLRTPELRESLLVPLSTYNSRGAEVLAIKIFYF